MKNQEQEQTSKNNDEEIDILKLRDDFKVQSEELATLKNKLGEYETQLNLKEKKNPPAKTICSRPGPGPFFIRPWQREMQHQILSPTVPGRVLNLCPSPPERPLILLSHSGNSKINYF